MSAIRRDDCTAEVTSVWGSVDGGMLSDPSAIDPATERHRILEGEGPGGVNARELWTQEGDDYYQMRAELGRNEWRYGINGGPGTFMLYEAGMTTQTALWLRLGDDYPLELNAWSVILQQKQAQPCGNTVPETGPAMTLNAYGGRLHLERFWKDLWSCPISVGQWTRIGWMVCHRDDPSGWTALKVLSAEDVYESPRFDGATLLREPSGNTSGRRPTGAPCPSHLRAGVYHALGTQPRSVRYAHIGVRAAWAE